MTNTVLALVAAQPCVVRGCHAPVEVAHIHGALSPKTGLELPRRRAAASVVAIPACTHHHRTASDSIHALGERGFERAHGLPDHHLLRVALTILARHALGDRA